MKEPRISRDQLVPMVRDAIMALPDSQKFSIPHVRDWLKANYNTRGGSQDILHPIIKELKEQINFQTAQAVKIPAVPTEISQIYENNLRLMWSRATVLAREAFEEERASLEIQMEHLRDSAERTERHLGAYEAEAEAEAVRLNDTIADLRRTLDEKTRAEIALTTRATTAEAAQKAADARATERERGIADLEAELETQRKSRTDLEARVERAEKRADDADARAERALTGEREAHHRFDALLARMTLATSEDGTDKKIGPEPRDAGAKAANGREGGAAGRRS